MTMRFPANILQQQQLVKTISSVTELVSDIGKPESYEVAKWLANEYLKFLYLEAQCEGKSKGGPPPPAPRRPVMVALARDEVEGRLGAARRRAEVVARAHPVGHQREPGTSVLSEKAQQPVRVRS